MEINTTNKGSKKNYILYLGAENVAFFPLMRHGPNTVCTIGYPVLALMLNFTLTVAPARVTPPSNEVYVSYPAVTSAISHLSSSPPEFILKMESMISLSILLGSSADVHPLDAPCCGYDPPTVCCPCPERNDDLRCRSVFCGGSVFDEPITHHVGSSPSAKSSGYFASSLYMAGPLTSPRFEASLLDLLLPPGQSPSASHATHTIPRLLKWAARHLHLSRKMPCRQGHAIYTQGKRNREGRHLPALAKLCSRAGVDPNRLKFHSGFKNAWNSSEPAACRLSLEMRLFCRFPEREC